MRKEGKLIMGVGHRVKSVWKSFLESILSKNDLTIQINNPDMRVTLLKQFAKQHFPVTPLLDYALEVEKITVSKVCLSMIIEDSIDKKSPVIDHV